MPESLEATRLPQLLGPVAADLERVEGWLAEQLQSEEAHLEPLLAHLARFRGKRVRAAQVLLVARAAGELRPEHTVVAGIIEMIHAATLVHDDLLDDSLQRRGLDCLHVQWGAHASVLLGDWIYARAFRRSTELDDPLCSRVLAEATTRVCRGEIHQNLTRGDFELSEDDYLAQIDGKTGALYDAGGRLGAAYAGADETVTEACARHGRDAGRAFQVMDDLLDLVGDERRVRKSLGTDWARGKMTLPLIRLRDALSTAERERLRAAFGSGADRSVLLEGEFAGPFSNAVESCRAEIRDLLRSACDELGHLPASPARDALCDLTEFLGARHF